MNVRVNKWLDLLDRAGWTAVQAAGAAALMFLTSDDVFEWSTFLKFVGYAAGLSVLKVIVGQNTGDDDTGALIGQPVVEPAPKADGARNVGG